MKKLLFRLFVLLLSVLLLPSCTQTPVPGCTDTSATNYNASANEEDGSCTYWVGAAGAHQFGDNFCLAVSNSIMALGGLSSICFSTDNGNNWTTVSNGVLYNVKITSIGITGNTIIAGTYGHGIYLSTDNGASWNWSNSGIDVSPNTTTTSITISGNNIYATINGSVYLSIDNGSNWMLLNNTIPITTLAINGNYLYGGTNGDGMYLSTDGGSNWTEINNGLNCSGSRDISSVVVTGNYVFAGTKGYPGCGVYVSSNNGGLWTQANNGFQDGHNRINYLAASGSNIFAGYSDNAMNFSGFIYLSRDNGSSWVQENILTGNILRALTINGNYIYADWGGVNGTIMKRQLPQ